MAQTGTTGSEPAEIRPTSTCRSYGSGHQVHWIQWNRARRDPDGGQPGTVVEIDDEAIVVEVAGEHLRIFNHELDRARDLLRVKGPDVIVQAGSGVLWFDTYLVSMRVRPLEPCSFDHPDGGATVRGATAEAVADELLRAVDR